MGRRVIDSLAGAGPFSAAFAQLNTQLAGSFTQLLPASGTLLSQVHVPLGQQKYSTNIHICSSSCSCKLAATSATQPAYSTISSPLSSSSSLGDSSRSPKLWFQPSSSSSFAGVTAVRGFASFTRASAHGLTHAGCGHDHSHDEPCTDETTSQLKHAGDLQQLQQLVQQHSSNMTANRAAAAFRRAAVLSGKTPAAAADVLNLLNPIWPGVLGQAGGKDLADVLLAWTKFQTQDEKLWAGTLAAVPAQVKIASGHDLANIVYGLAAMTEMNGGIPGVPREDVQELLRVITEEVVSLVQGGKGAGDGGAGGRSVSVGNLATVRWAHEVFEESGASAAA